MTAKRNTCPTIKARSEIHNKFHVEVIDARTGEVKQEAEAYNVICDRLWNTWYLENNWFNYIHYGTGEGTPSVSDTSLFSYLGGAAATGLVYENHPESRSFSARQQIQIAENVAVGATITEVGIAQAAGSGTLCTHAMLQDMNGNRISIMKSATDVINIYATVFVHVDSGDFGIISPLSGQSTILMQLLIGKAFAVNSNISFYGVDKIAYSPDGNNRWTVNKQTRKATWAAVRTPVGTANLAGGWLWVDAHTASGCCMDSWFSPPPIKGEAIGTGDGVKTDFATAFFGCKNARVYVDGNAVSSGVTVLENQPILLGSNNEASRFFARIDSKGQRASGVSLNGVRFAGSYFFENLLYGTLVPTSADNMGSQMSWFGSNNLRDWTPVTHSALGNYRYYRLDNPADLSGYPTAGFYAAGLNLTNVRFDTPPAEGAVITIDYTPKCVAKDSNHVFDFSLELSFGERQGV